MKLIIFIFIILFYFYLIIPKINYINSNILILSGTHGDETSPIIYFNKLLKSYNSLNVNLINPINKVGYLMKSRNGILQPDINRQYYQNLLYPINYFIINCMKNIKNKYKECIIFDFHEAKDYNSINKNSLGQTIYINLKLLKYKIKFYKLIDILNSKVEYPHQKYKIIYELPYEPNTLDDYCNKNDFSYCLIEISNKLQLSTRLEHIDIIYNFISLINGY